MKNRYIVRARISEDKFKELCQLFCAGKQANNAAKIATLSRPTVNKFFNAFRIRIVRTFQPTLDGSDAKSLVFGISVRNNKANITPLFDIPEQAFSVLAGIRNPSIPPHWLQYSALFDSSLKNLLVTDPDNDQENDIVQRLWSFTCGRFVQFRGIHQHKRIYHVYESLFRFNLGNDSKAIEQQLLKICRNPPIKLSAKDTLPTEKEAAVGESTKVPSKQPQA